MGSQNKKPGRKKKTLANFKENQELEKNESKEIWELGGNNLGDF